MNFNPDESTWINRDRFILSAGHGSMFLYSWLHLTGFPGVDIDQVSKFRALHSITPGHPEWRETPGVEATTGPLGQGTSNAVGYAVSQKMAAGKYNTAEHKIFTNKIYCLAGDGCMQEGVAMEALAFAGHFKLDNLVLIYDSNDVTLDAMAVASQSENAAQRFESIGFNVVWVQHGNDIAQISAALDLARAFVGKPTVVILRTTIGKGIAEVAGTSKAHGEGGAKFIPESKKKLGLPDGSHFFVSEHTRAFFTARKAALHAKHAAWTATFNAWKAANPALAADLAVGSHTVPTAEALFAKIPVFPGDAKIATRKAGQDVFQPLSAAIPNSVSGSADLHGSTLNYIASSGDFGPSNATGRNIRFGIREHGMGGITNGINYDGLFRCSCATFLVFTDYLRGSMRVAALSHVPSVYIFTHDSVGVGEDGPTHQPVETVAGMRLMPNMDVIRPADPEETAGAFVAAFTRTDGPTMLSLSRQALPNLSQIPVEVRRNGVLSGGYVAVQETAALDTILLSCGSELQHAVAAAAQLGPGTRVVSMPSQHRFDKQPAEYKEKILPRSCRKRVAIEAGVTCSWAKYIGLDGHIIGIDRFGMSAPGDVVMKQLGITADAVVAAAKAL